MSTQEAVRPGPPTRRDALVATVQQVVTAVRRQARFWLAAGAVGLLVGAVAAVVPAQGAASTRLLLVHRQGDQPDVGMTTDVSLATTRTVAQRVVDRMGLSTTADDLQRQYSATALTDRVLEISVTARSTEEARDLARTLGSVILDFRMEQARARLEPVRDDVRDARARVSELRAGAVPANTALGSDGSEQRRRLADAERRVDGLEAALDKEQDATSVMSQSRTLDPPRADRGPLLPAMALVAAVGLAAGLVLGIAFVAVRALLSGRLWRRTAIADALDARIALQLGRVTGRRWWHRLWPLVPRPSGPEAVRSAVRQLRSDAVWAQASRPTLAVVAVDCADEGAHLVAELASSYAAEGRNVLVADLSRRGALAARLGVTSAGTRPSGVGAIADRVTVHLPERSAIPEGRLLRLNDDAEDDDLLVAWAVADLVVSLVELRPAVGGDHLRSWSTRAVALVAAGRSTVTRLRSTTEMIRGAGVRIESALLLRSDRPDVAVRAESRPLLHAAGVARTTTFSS
ncbi:MAG: hypothetical protein GEV10_11375 [Streptosporangiales bacterium]|nr:hypothetical protein [Streptosporangiales bacterium]